MEWETIDGSIIALCNKMYICYDRNSDTTKRSTKGIPHSIKVELDRFKECLLNTGEQHFVKINSLRHDPKHQMCRMTTQKRGLSDIFIKLQVGEDKISCLPLRQNGTIL